MKNAKTKLKQLVITNWDMNNLYACAMIDLLPTGGHVLVEEYDINTILSTADDNPVGCLLRVDRKFPDDKHELCRQYPPAPENTSPKNECMTQYQHDVAGKTRYQLIAFVDGLNESHICMHIIVMLLSVGT